MRIIRFAARLISAVLTAVVAIVLVCNLYMIGAKTFLDIKNPTVFGYSWAVVISGSMSGSIEIDDMVIVHREDAYAKGDVICFESGSSLVTHRIVEESAEGFVTKGDANNTTDLEPVMQEQIVGRVVYVVPGVGTAIKMIRTPRGVIGIVLIGSLLVTGSYMLVREENEQTGGKTDDE